MITQITFLDNRETLEYEVASIAEAVAQAIENKDELRYADLRGAHLSDADLSHANLSYADLKHAILIRTNLHYANLSDADLSYADLSNANFSYANFRNTKLAGAKIQGKQLWITRPFLSLGQCGSADRTTLVFFFEDNSEPFIMCGCFEGGLQEVKTKVKETHAGTFHEVEYNAMVNYIKALYKEQQEK